MKLDTEYTFDDLKSMIFDGTAPAHCTECGGYVTQAEPDADWKGGPGLETCKRCGEGTRIASVLRIKGLI